LAMVGAMTGAVDNAGQPPHGKCDQAQAQPTDSEHSFQAVCPVIGSDVVTGSPASSHASSLSDLG